MRYTVNKLATTGDMGRVHAMHSSKSGKKIRGGGKVGKFFNGVLNAAPKVLGLVQPGISAYNAVSGLRGKGGKRHKRRRRRRHH